MRSYVTLTFGAWDDNLQRQMHDAWFDPARVQIVEINGEHVGVLDAEDRGDHLYVSRIEVTPEWQGRGIGTAVMADVISDGRPVELHVLRANLKARALYQRLGFVEIANDLPRVRMRHPGQDPPTNDAATQRPRRRGLLAGVSPAEVDEDRDVDAVLGVRLRIAVTSRLLFDQRRELDHAGLDTCE
jgi:hypothetical protein